MEQKAEYYDRIYTEPYDWKQYRSTYERLIKHLPTNKKVRIFDMGCGVGGFLTVCWENGYKNLSGIDFSQNAIRQATELLPKEFDKSRLVIGDLNFITDMFIRQAIKVDVIVMIELLEHIEEDVELVKKARKLLKKDGFIIGTVPNRQMPPEVVESHVRMYDERSFMERFQMPGRLLQRSKIGESILHFVIFKFWEKTPEPKISFVIPAYGGDHYLSETIDSLVQQTIEEIEIIVVNDASPDYTHDLMQWWMKNDSRIRYFRLKENKGVVYARNYGNRQAKAPIICVSDQDDLSMPERAEKTLRIFQNYPKTDVVYSAFYETDVDGEPLTKYDAEPMNRDIFVKGTWKTWFHSSAAYRRKDILELPYKRARNGETDDWMFLETWTKAGKQFKPIQEVLANCRRLPSGVMAQRRKQAGLPPNFSL